MVAHVARTATYRQNTMLKRLAGLAAAVCATLAITYAPAQAHPHVWVTMTSQLIYAPNGTATGIRHSWAFDDMYSAFATEGLEQKNKGVFTREELASLAEVNVSSLKEFDFFTFAKVDGKKTPLAEPVDYWLDYKNEVLTLHFTLPFKSPVKAQNLDVEVYDPTYFVDFAFAEKTPVALVGAPAQCKLSFAKPEDASATSNKPIDESMFTSGNWGAQFANKISVKCP
jgi:ABC-type uncharacterized transport system substrate-binding protein